MLSTKWIFPACGGLVLALAGIQANATVLATSDLEIQSLTVSSDNLEAITIIGGTRNGTTTVNFDGDIPTPLSDVKAALDDVDLAPLCAGPDCGSVPYTGDNDSTTELQPDDGNFAYADLFVSGSALAGGAAGYARADAVADGTFNAIGSANAEIANNLLSEFVIAVDETVTFAFEIQFDLFVRSFVSPENFGTDTTANASTDFTIEIFQDGVGLFEFDPSELNQSTNAFGRDGNNNVIIDEAGMVMSDNVTLGPGVYNVAITQKGAADILAAPAISEPSTIMLLGLGVLGLGLGAARRRR